MNDIEIISKDDARRVPETACAFANSSGGRIICEGFEPLKFMPPGVPYSIESDGSVYVPALAWRKRPIALNGRVYRRIEGQNVISGLRAKSLIAADAHESSRDDRPAGNLALNEKAISEFFEKVTELHPEMKIFERGEFLRRCGVFSGKFLTFAGALMFGDILNVRAVLDYPKRRAEIEVSNIWLSYTEILPRLTSALSPKCSEAFTEIFTNALLHSDYNIDSNINITIIPAPARAVIDNPGTIRGAIRNHRLEKMFALSGITHRKFHGLDIIRSYMPNFTLQQDMLELRTISTLNLEGHSELPDPVIL